MDIEHIDSGIASGAAPPADECRSIGPTRAWANLWFVTWLSTATGGGFFGVVMAAHTHRPSELLLFIVFVFFVAFVGALVVPTVCAIRWIIKLPQFPRAQSGFAGAATGLACAWAAIPSWSTVVAPMVGGIAAFAGADIFIRRSAVAGPIREAIRLQKLKGWPSRSFANSDLVARITVAGILVAVWMKILTNH